MQPCITILSCCFLVAEKPRCQLPIWVESNPPLVSAYVRIRHVPFVVTYVMVLKQIVIQHVVNPKDIHTCHQIEWFTETTHLVFLIFANLILVKINFQGSLGEYLERPK